MLDFIKAHAYGNDFLYVRLDDVWSGDGPGLARALCERHTGIGADGLIVYRPTDRGASMRLYNADGSYSEVSGNGVRGLAAILARWRGLAPRPEIAADPLVIETDAGEKTLTLLDLRDGRYVFRASMGMPSDLRQVDLDVGGEQVSAVVLRVGNPQCVILEHTLDDARYHRLGPLLEHHPAFPEGTNVSFVRVEAPGRIAILIWERGVGPTLASGTGACGAAVAAAAFGGAAKTVDVGSPGGSQHVEWLSDGIYLTGWAEVLFEGRWIG